MWNLQVILLQSYILLTSQTASTILSDSQLTIYIYKKDINYIVMNIYIINLTSKSNHQNMFIISIRDVLFYHHIW